MDYALTIAISVAAGASAVTADVPALAPARVGLAEVLPPGVAGLTLFGHAGRLVFALMTISFALVGSVVIIAARWPCPAARAVGGPGGVASPIILMCAASADRHPIWQGFRVIMSGHSPLAVGSGVTR